MNEAPEETKVEVTNQTLDDFELVPPKVHLSTEICESCQ